MSLAFIKLAAEKILVNAFGSPHPTPTNLVDAPTQQEVDWRGWWSEFKNRQRHYRQANLMRFCCMERIRSRFMVGCRFMRRMSLHRQRFTPDSTASSSSRHQKIISFSCILSPSSPTEFRFEGAGGFSSYEADRMLVTRTCHSCR
jgi:hypothetical protein